MLLGKKLSFRLSLTLVAREQRMFMQIKLLIIFITLFSLVPNFALAESVEKAAEQIYYETLSPFCPGRALADCPTEQATNLKAKILSDLESGKSKDVVQTELLKEYGEHLSSVPSLSGWNAIAWIMPIVLLLAGFAVVILKIRSGQRDQEDEAS